MNANLAQTAVAAAGHRDPCESWSRAQLEEWQLAKLRVQLARVARDSAYYGPLLRQLGWNVGQLHSLEDLRQLPLTRKADYVGSIDAATPFGRFMCAPQEDVLRMHFSSGTTAAPTPQFWTGHDLDRWADLYARHAHAQGVTPADIMQCMFGFTWFVGGLGATAGYQKLGAMCIPAGSQDTERQIAVMYTYGSTVLCGTPSFITHLAEEVSRRGLDPRLSKVRAIMLGGEPGASIAATRERIEALWDARCFDAYGCLEFQPIAGECSAQAGPHIAEDFVYAEVIDADSGAAVPDGSPGVLVLTHLDKQAGPLVRWWTGDVVVRDASTCRCGRTHARLVGGVRGRADDMLVVRGVNVFPSAVEQLVRAIPALGDEYRIVIDESVRDAAGFLKAIRVQVEVRGVMPGGQAGGANSTDSAGLAEQLTLAIKKNLQVSAVVEVLPDGTLARSTHKAKRVVREGQIT